jgi:hypothetical protein
MGGSLAISPATSLTTGFNVAYLTNPHFTDFVVPNSDRVLSTVDVGFSTIVWARTLLNVTAQFGITGHVPDFRLITSLPVRFWGKLVCSERTDTRNKFGDDFVPLGSAGALMPSICLVASPARRAARQIERQSFGERDPPRHTSGESSSGDREARSTFSTTFTPSTACGSADADRWAGSPRAIAADAITQRVCQSVWNDAKSAFASCGHAAAFALGSNVPSSGHCRHSLYWWGFCDAMVVVKGKRWPSEALRKPSLHW